MALKFSESPAVRIREVDLTGVVPGVTSSTGAIVGDFAWGPTEIPIFLGTESELASTFGSPLAGGNADDFLSAAYFLKYSSSAFVVRASKEGADASSALPFSAKYFGSLGDTLSVHVCDAGRWSADPSNPVLDSEGDPVLDSDGLPVLGPWTYQSEFSSAPVGTELHVVVVSTVEGEKTVIETYDYVSTESTSRLDNGSTNYIQDVINATSSWISLNGSPGPVDYSLTGGSDGDQNAEADYFSAYGVFADKDTIQVDFLIPPAGVSGDLQKSVTLQKELVRIAELRKDCVAVVSPSLSAGELSVDAMLAHVSSLATNSSYLFVDGNWLKVYNKYQDKYTSIPAASSTAGLMAATDAVAAAWFSPAGSRRGQYLGVTDLLVNPSKSQRDQLYKAGINPVVSFPGQGIMLYGDKTHLSRPSAFDRINVRRLFLVLERAISAAAENVMFEFNDEFTRAEFVNIVEPFLREVQGRRGITDFKVVCDETNNTSEVIDRNEFIASCFIKPARSINYVTLNFVAVRSGVDFEEVVGSAGV